MADERKLQDEVKDTAEQVDELSDEQLDEVAGGADDLAKLSQMQQAMSNVLNAMHQQAMNAIRKL